MIGTVLSLLMCGAAAVPSQTPPPVPVTPGQESVVSPPTSRVPGPAVRPLPAAVASTVEPLGAPNQVRALSDGRVLVNDGLRRRLLLFDSALTTHTVIADSASGSANAYGTRAASLIAYPGDSSLLIDAASLAMLVIDPAGQIVRVKAIPRTQDVTPLSSSTGTTYGTPGFDAQGRLIYRGQTPSALPRIPPGGGVLIPDTPDSAAIRRIDLRTRALDSVARVKVNRSSYIATQSPSGGISLRSRANPLPLIDDWAVMTDGSIALVRGRDYHVDWINPDGTESSSPKMPFDWQRLDLPDKERILDSIKTLNEQSMQRMIAQMQTRYDSLAEIARKNGGPMPPPPPTAEMYGMASYVPADELPDYRPPFSIGAVRADADNNLWIRTNPMRPTPGGPVYDVVNRNGEVIDRIQFTGGRTLVGFGPGGVVYVLARGQTGAKLEKVVVGR